MSQYLSDPYRQFIHTSRYARWLDYEVRRETWGETVDRYMVFLSEHLRDHADYTVPEDLYSDLRTAIYNQDIMPSMRALMTAGPALARNNVAGFNCSYLPIDSIRSFDEVLYILMNGTGVGYSVEKKYVDQLPPVAENFHKTDSVVVVGDSKEGWAASFREVLALLWAGQIPSWDTSKVRPAGARLKTFGGRASGPGPLEDLFAFTVNLMTNAAGRKLTTLEAHDLVCKIASVVVVGGVRRSALISLSDLSDNRMALAKSGQWWESNPQRALANNSVAYTVKPDMASFMSEWKTLYDSKSGERGIFNRWAAKRLVPERRDSAHDFGTNPCGEIVLRPYQFCNLTEVVVRPDDTEADLARKVVLATALGTFQSTLTNFKYLRRIWKKNTEEERLLGVSLTGQFGHPVLSGSEGVQELTEWLSDMRNVAIETNAVYADELGIPRSAAITTVKPSGTVSQLVGVSSGMHPWHSEYYIRTVRADKKDPLTQFLIDHGIPVEDEIHSPGSTAVFSFPVKAPKGAITRNELTAVDHLNIWRAYKESWTEHNPSITVNVREHEWMAVGAWVYENFDIAGGISFLPHSEHIYKQAPYQEIDKAAYEALLEKMPSEIRWQDLTFYELNDGTTGSQELACSSELGCEVVDLVSSS